MLNPAKQFLHFLGGISLGIYIYELILIDLNFTDYAALIAGTSLSLTLGTGCVLSSQIRCIFLLTIPTFCGKVGRSVLKTLIIALIISGPIQNISTNGKELVRVFACTTSLTFNLTKTRFELMFKPFADALFGLKSDANEIKDTLRSIKDVSAPIVGEVEDEREMKKLKEENDYLDESLGDTSRSEEIDDKYKSIGEKTEAKRFEKMYVKKIEMRCEDQFSKAAQKCRKVFEKAYNKCYEVVTWVAAWLLCWPMKLTFVCNIPEAMGGSGKCDPSKHFDPGFGKGYEYLKNSRSAFSENFKNVKMQYKVTKIKELVDLRDGREAAKALLHTVETKKVILDQLLVVVKRILAFVFLRIIINAQHYHDNYLRNIQFDNCYITKYFHKIDTRRKFNGKFTLIPLKKTEAKKIVEAWSKKCLAHEKQDFYRQGFKVLIEIIVTSVFVLIDHLFYECLDLIRRHGRIEYVQIGHHDLKLEIKGTGMIANLLRSVVKGFNIKKRINIERNNEMCLPRPNHLAYYYYLKIYGFFLLIFFLMLSQVYTQRFRRAICAYFYRKREKRRILFLYNDMLKKRIRFFKHMRKRVQKMIREHRLRENYNVFTTLRIKYPKLCNFLKIFSMARRQCLICKEREGFSGKFIQCMNKNCYFVYCSTCWKDMEKRCVVCLTLDEAAETTSGMDDEDNSDQFMK